MKGLGRGLDALISSNYTGSEVDILEVNLTDIDSNLEQPRKSFDEDTITELAKSIKEHGIIQPIVVSRLNNRYKIIAGERRWRAAKIAGISKIPVIVKNLSSKEILEIALIENLQREDLNSIEEAEAYTKLVKAFSLTQEEVSKRIGKSRSYVTNIMRLLSLDESIKDMISNKKITYGHAKALLSLEDNGKQLEIANRIMDENLSVREVENIVRKINETKAPNKLKKKTQTKNSQFVEMEENLRMLFNTKVNIITGNKKGKIEIEYYSKDDLERILETIMQTKEM